MKISKIYHHNQSDQVIPSYLLDEIYTAVESVDADICRTKMCKEKIGYGNMVLSPKDINLGIADNLNGYGWKERRETFFTTDDASLVRATLNLPVLEQKRIIEEAGCQADYGFYQTDFLKEKVAVEVQFGKYAFISHDFDKFTSLFNRGIINAGIEVVVMRNTLTQMSSGPGCYQQALRALVSCEDSRSFPLTLIGIEP
jgi:hypothetical protein